MTVHELTHQWRVNQNAAMSSGGHCDGKFGARQLMVGSSTLYCTMTSGVLYTLPEASDDIVGFHYVKVDGSADSEFLSIRWRNEPVPQDEHKRILP